MSVANNTTILLIDREGIAKPLCAKNLEEETLHKKCGFKNANNFAKICDFEMGFADTLGVLTVKLFGKTSGSNSLLLNAISTPTTHIYGTCALVFYDKDGLAVSYKNEWDNQINQTIPLTEWFASHDLLKKITFATPKPKTKQIETKSETHAAHAAEADEKQILILAAPKKKGSKKKELPEIDDKMHQELVCESYV